MPLTAALRIAIAARQTATLDLSNAHASLAQDYPLTLTDGAAAGQANRMFADTRTVAPGGVDDLDLAGGGLLDVLGAPVSFARVKALIVAAAAGNTNDVVVGGAPTGAFASWAGGAGHTVVVPPGAVHALLAGQADPDGWPVTPTSGDVLRIANSGAGTPVTYDITIIGAAS